MSAGFRPKPFQRPSLSLTHREWRDSVPVTALRPGDKLDGRVFSVKSIEDRPGVRRITYVNLDFEDFLADQHVRAQVRAGT